MKQILSEPVLSPGLIRLPSWHDHLFFFISGGMMKGRFLITGMLFLVLAGLVGADFISTTINTDGSALLTTSGSDENGSFVSRAMTMDTARISRTASGEPDLQTDLVVSGSGPVLFSDYASGLLKTRKIRELCAFLDGSGDQSGGESAVYTSGILESGEYAVSRTIGSGLEGMATVNGSGLLFFGSQSQDNRSMNTHGFVTGNMSVRDLVRYGGRL
jgi:hypothetical protein